MSIIKLKLGNEERSLCFSKLGFLKYLGEVSKSDPIDFFNSDLTTDPSKSYKACLYIIYAGLMCTSMLNGQHEYTIEQVDRWVQDLETSQIKDIVVQAIYAMAGKTVPEGEPVAQTENLSGSIN